MSLAALPVAKVKKVPLFAVKSDGDNLEPLQNISNSPGVYDAENTV